MEEVEVYKRSIKDWAEEDRPREKLLSKGNQALSNAELLAILINSGNKEDSAVELSKKILNSVDNNLNELGMRSVNHLASTFKGIGKAKAITIIAALELGRRRKLEEALTRKKIGCSRDAFLIFQPILSDLPHEEAWVLFLNRGNKVMERKKVSAGGITVSVIDVKMIMKEAVDRLASGIVLGHNHPSGNPYPSDTDKLNTQKLKEACYVFDIAFQDHIIIAGDDYFSFADENMIL
jgi:DNA repair protein RadC